MSLQVAPQYVNKVKAALKRNGYPTQRGLAEQAEMSLATVSNFLNGKPVHFINFVELCGLLGLEWQEIKDEDVSGDDGPGSPTSRHDLDSAPDVKFFVGRNKQLATLKSWILEDTCRLGFF